MTIPPARDYTRYHYFAITITTPIFTTFSLFCSALKAQLPSVEYIGKIGELVDVIEVRVTKPESTEKGGEDQGTENKQKDDIRFVENIKTQLETLNGVGQVSVQIPRVRVKRE